MLEFEQALAAIPTGYTEGEYAGRRWGATVKRSADMKRISLFAEDLSGTDIVSFNFYRLDGGDALKPCEMSSEKVMAFVIGYRFGGSVGEAWKPRGRLSVDRVSRPDQSTHKDQIR